MQIFQILITREVRLRKVLARLRMFCPFVLKTPHEILTVDTYIR